MKKYFIIPILLWGITSFAQKKIENLTFENVENNFPALWKTIGGSSGKVSADYHEKQEGEYSAVIENTDAEGFTGLLYTLPDNYTGKKITLSGYLKTENVTGVNAGLWMRIDPQIAFDNMKDTGLKGTNNWKKYEITLNMSPENTEKIVFGALLSGKGKMWVDNLKITIDGKDINDAKLFEKKLTKIDLDKEFDNGSKISHIDLSRNNIENSKVLGLIWGYLKYYHPSVAAGNYNWDYELFRIYPKINGTSADKRDQVLTDWIKSLGTFKTKNYTEAKNVKMKADLDWITGSGFSKELTDLLLALRTAERQDTNYYVSIIPEVQNPNFKNEKAYPSMSSPDAGFRLLSLYRYWNMIQYYYPYRYAIGEDWKKVLEEFIPKFSHADDQTKYALTCLELAARINDSHASVRNSIIFNYFGQKFSPLEIVFVGNTAVVKDYYDEILGKETGLKAGDIILEIDGKTVEEIISEKSKYLPASNHSAKLNSLSYVLLSTNNDTINLKFSTDGNIKTVSAKTYKNTEIKYTQKRPSPFTMLDDQTAYMYMNDIKKEQLPDIFKKIKGTKGLVIDLRTYPSQFMVYEMGNFLMPKPEQFATFSSTTTLSPGEFTMKAGSPVGTSNKDYYRGKIAVLVNETSVSRSEFFTMAFQKAPKAKVFGSQTAGADGDVSYFMFPGNIPTTITGIGVYYPDGKETQRIGIVPDEEVKPTIEGIKNNKDEVLEKAVKWINN